MDHPPGMSSAALDALKAREALRLKAYLDGGGVPTIGWGHTRGVALGQTCTEYQAGQFLNTDLQLVYHDILNIVEVSLSQGQFDGLADWWFNVGTGHAKASTLVAKLNAKEYDAAAAEFIRWIYDNGKVQRGLAKRRGQEFIFWYS